MKITAQVSLTRKSGFKLDAMLEIKPEGVTALYGPSGSGKSTLLRLLAGLERGSPEDTIRITSGDIIWHDQSTFVAPEKRGLGFVFQQQQLFPHLNVEGNLAFAEQRQHQKLDIDRQQVSEWLDLEPLMAKAVDQLSGGEAQRVAIARVLLNGCQCILMDEPLGSIDKAARSRILPYLERLHQNLNIPMVYVSHSFEEIAYLADYLYVIRNGTVAAQGSLIDLSSNLELNLEQGESAATVIHCAVTGLEPEYGLSELSVEGAKIFVSADKYALGDFVRVRIPARDVSITTTRPKNSSILNIIEARIESFEESSGPGALIRLQIGQQFILARITRKSLDILHLQIGQRVFAQIKSVALITDNSHE